MHPPFAKLLFGLAGWFVGFDGHFNFENIGDSYTDNHVPYVGMRALPAILGSLTIPVVYGIMKESGYGTVISAFSASLILFGTYCQLGVIEFLVASLSQITHISPSRASYYWTPPLSFSSPSLCIPTCASVSCDMCTFKPSNLSTLLKPL